MYQSLISQRKTRPGAKGISVLRYSSTDFAVLVGTQYSYFLKKYLYSYLYSNTFKNKSIFSEYLTSRPLLVILNLFKITLINYLSTKFHAFN